MNSWIKSVHDAHKARDAAGNVGEAKEIQKWDQAQESAPSLDTRIGRKLTHTPNTPAVQVLRAIPGYDRLVRRPLPPTQAPQDIFFKKA